MKLWQRLWRRRPQAAPQDPTFLAGRINPLLDGLQKELMSRHAEALLELSAEEMAPAVWGASRSGPLTPEQRRIHEVVLPVVRQVHRQLDLARLDEPRRFAVDFLLRGYILNRLAFALEAARQRGLAAGPEAQALRELEPMGTA
jgi:hypothetical protein